VTTPKLTPVLVYDTSGPSQNPEVGIPLTRGPPALPSDRQLIGGADAIMDLSTGGQKAPHLTLASRGDSCSTIAATRTHDNRGNIDARCPMVSVLLARVGVMRWNLSHNWQPRLAEISKTAVFDW